MTGKQVNLPAMPLATAAPPQADAAPAAAEATPTADGLEPMAEDTPDPAAASGQPPSAGLLSAPPQAAGDEPQEAAAAASGAALPSPPATPDAQAGDGDTAADEELIRPWLDHSGRVSRPVWLLLTRRALATVARHPGAATVLSSPKHTQPLRTSIDFAKLLAKSILNTHPGLLKAVTRSQTCGCHHQCCHHTHLRRDQRAEPQVAAGAGAGARDGADTDRAPRGQRAAGQALCRNAGRAATLLHWPAKAAHGAALFLFLCRASAWFHGGTRQLLWAPNTSPVLLALVLQTRQVLLRVMVDWISELWRLLARSNVQC